MSGRRKSPQDEKPIPPEQVAKILDPFLQLPDNRECADCGAKGIYIYLYWNLFFKLNHQYNTKKGPRWASVNLGIFICIRCSGIHRSLGTHISKVKSVSLDKWFPEQLEFIKNMGNGKAREIYEANVPHKYIRPKETDGNQ